MSKFLLVVIVLGMGALAGLAIRELWPDVQRYLRLRSM